MRKQLRDFIGFAFVYVSIRVDAELVFKALGLHYPTGFLYAVLWVLLAILAGKVWDDITNNDPCLTEYNRLERRAKCIEQ